MREMASGAGHDAAYIARVAPTTMIFVPCLGGISHNEAESTTFEECGAGSQVLLNAVLEYDRQIGVRNAAARARGDRAGADLMALGDGNAGGSGVCAALAEHLSHFDKVWTSAHSG